MSLRSRQCVGNLKMAGTVRAAAFTADGGHLLTSGALILTTRDRSGCVLQASAHMQLLQL